MFYQLSGEIFTFLIITFNNFLNSVATICASSRERGEKANAELIASGAITLGNSSYFFAIRLGACYVVVGVQTALMSQRVSNHKREEASMQQAILYVPILSDHGYRNQLLNWTGASGGMMH